ncbi:uncharacterized protein G2W53_032254 [Senna tora]|uniref:Uncharacterized protein n=1 Tax=Senna tora TaxID=362788 RepID=A0A834W7I9_9FABA|nr:uncharacterized protein G2W53_032254 [Senna tora]
MLSRPPQYEILLLLKEDPFLYLPNCECDSRSGAWMQPKPLDRWKTGAPRRQSMFPVVGPFWFVYVYVSFPIVFLIQWLFTNE